MKHYLDEYTNSNFIYCDNPAELRALFIILMSEKAENISIEYQDKLAIILDKPFRIGATNILIKAIETNYNIRVVLKEFNVMIDL